MSGFPLALSAFFGSAAEGRSPERRVKDNTAKQANNVERMFFLLEWECAFEQEQFECQAQNVVLTKPVPRFELLSAPWKRIPAAKIAHE